MHHSFVLGDAIHPVALSRSSTAYRLHLGEELLDIDLRTGANGGAWLRVGEEHIAVVIATHGDDIFVHLEGETYQLRHLHPLDRLEAAADGSAEDRILAPMPGSIVSVAAQAGDAVCQGQSLLIMESMKMETTIVAPRDGVVVDVTYGQGESFERDAVLVMLQSAERRIAQDGCS